MKRNFKEVNSLIAHKMINLKEILLSIRRKNKKCSNKLLIKKEESKT